MSHGPLTLALGQIRKMLGRETARDQPDHDLLRRFVVHRDEAAFAELLERFGPLVLGVCRRMLRHEQDAEDAFQAVFLVLSRNAASVRRQQSIGSWLYGVALRIAVKARTKSARHKVAAMIDDQEPLADEPNPVTTTAATELRSVLDEELNRLPARDRELLILCDLQGVSHQEAARKLGLPSGSISRHVARARELLRDRLSWRGVAVTAGLLTAALTAEESRAAVPVALTSITLQGVTKVLAGQAVLGVFSTQAVALAESTMREMLMSKVKVTVAVVLAAGLVGAMTGAVWYQSTIHAAPADDQPAAEARVEPKPDGKVPAAARPSTQHQEKLDKKIDLEQLDNIPLGEILELLSDRYAVPIHLNVEAFEAGQHADVANAHIKLPKMKGMRLGQVLSRVVAQVDGAYLIRSDGVEVTTSQHVTPSAWMLMPRQHLPTATALLDKKPLEEALADLAEASGINIVIDPAAGEKSKKPLTANLKGVPLDTAVRLLADMADLKVLAVDNVLYVTTAEKAKDENGLGGLLRGGPLQ